MVLAVGLLAACEVIGPGERNDVIFTPTDPSAVKRTSLLIEYSGWQCVNCPTAAGEAHHLKELYGEELVVVVMHPESNPNTRYGNNQAVNFTCPEGKLSFICSLRTDKDSTVSYRYKAFLPCPRAHRRIFQRMGGR